MKMSQNWSISDPKRVQMGSNRVLYQFGSIRTKSQPKRTNGNPKQPIFHFFRVSIFKCRHFRRIRRTFWKMFQKWVRYFFGTEFPRRRELWIDGVEMSNGATATNFRPDKLLGFLSLFGRPLGKTQVSSERARSAAGPRQLHGNPGGAKVGAPGN